METPVDSAATTTAENSITHIHSNRCDAPGSQISLPPLENGDRLNRDEFERRYEAMPDHIKAELIDGRVYLMASPVSHRGHGKPHARMICWLYEYEKLTPHIEFSDNVTLRLEQSNEPQPDICLRIVAEAGGQSVVDDNDFIQGAPELVVEIAASSVSYDLHDKLDVYRRSGVNEYIVWRTNDQAIDWFVHRGGNFVPLARGDDGVHRSGVFPGLWLDTDALLRDDMKRVAAAVADGAKSMEHAEFVARLESALASSGTN